MHGERKDRFVSLARGGSSQTDGFSCSGIEVHLHVTSGSLSVARVEFFCKNRVKDRGSTCTLQSGAPPSRAWLKAILSCCRLSHQRYRLGDRCEKVLLVPLRSAEWTFLFTLTPCRVFDTIAFSGHAVCEC